jgi:hypothetical protein
LPRPITATGRSAAHGYDEKVHQDATGWAQDRRITGQEVGSTGCEKELAERQARPGE